MRETYTYTFTVRTRAAGLGKHGTITRAARRRLAHFGCIAVKGDTITINVAPQRSGEYTALQVIDDVISDMESTEFAVHISVSSPDAHSSQRWLPAYHPRPSAHLRRLCLPRLVPLRYQAQAPREFGALQRITTTRSAPPYEDIESADALCRHLAGVARICFGGDCSTSRRCTCWDARNMPKYNKPGANRTKLKEYREKFKAIRDVLAARERELRAGERAALNVLHIAEGARTLPQEVLDMIFGFLGLGQGVYTLSFSTRNASLIGPARGECMNKPVRRVAKPFACMKARCVRPGTSASLTIAIPPRASRQGDEEDAFRAAVDMLNALEIVELEFDIALAVEDEYGASVAGVVVGPLVAPALRRLRVPYPGALWALDRAAFPALQRVEAARSSGVQHAIDCAEKCLSLPTITTACLAQCGNAPCTCWDDVDAAEIACKPGTARRLRAQYRNKAARISRTLAARRQAAKEAQVTALAVMYLADDTHLPREVWDMVWAHAGLSEQQVARATELGRGDATLARRAAAMARLEGEAFRTAMSEWLVDEGFGPAPAAEEGLGAEHEDDEDEDEEEGEDEKDGDEDEK
ncbi:uncharacterized protein LOC62_04G005437 [Vanrija pseudolonga]|uniref:Uncharacterized protein n=1 Tax=Vanrija pseudolonga TaxID=143232 RepID=A0AAF0Y8D9_9TREE|nr:hypothetical protein LOC62_04G005437 [Vanrija pseudolonga]